MFDDQPIGGADGAGGQPPTNLPLGEPAFAKATAGEAEDIFSESEPSDEPIAPAKDGEEPAKTAPPAETALGAGVLRPKPAASFGVTPPTAAAAIPTKPAFPPPPPIIPLSKEPPAPLTELPPETIGGYAVKKPSFLKELLVAMAVIIFLVLIVGGGWVVYSRLRQAPASPQQTSAARETSAPAAEAPAETQSPEAPSAASAESRSVDEKVLFGDTVDSDSDGLTDEEERRRNTDPRNWDMDNDTLSDGDEVLIWHTSPTSADTDGDGYQDGVEVKNGFNPNGPGKIFAAPTST